MEFDKAKKLLDLQLRDKVLTEIFEDLRAPFDPEEIYWKPQATNRDRTSAVAAAYADPRAYSDRLNEVLGPDGWTCEYTATVIAPLPPNPAAPIKENEWKPKLTYNGKVLIVAKLSIVLTDGTRFTHSGTGEEEATNENAITSAEAQAFKRAATRFGLGRYLYDLPKNQWHPYDKESKKFTTVPSLPDWAIPKKKCEICTLFIVPFQYGDRTLSVTELIANGQRKYKQQLCAVCQKKKAELIKHPPISAADIERRD